MGAEAVAARTRHSLRATPETVHWGFFSGTRPPVLEVRSGDLVEIETITHQAGDAPDLLMDSAIAAVFDQVVDRGPGPHILTGPIFVAGARPGDALAVRILEATPRLPHGTNLAAAWGALHGAFGKERVTVYELDTKAGRARPQFAFDWTATPRADAIGTVVAPESTRRERVTPGISVPLRPHFGVMGVAPRGGGRIDTVPPGPFGGNVDNWRLGPGAVVYYPVAHDGALLSIGDPHAAEGDGELSGTAIEASLNGVIEVTVVHGVRLTSPVARTADHWITHGFGPDLDTALRGAAEAMLELLTGAHGLSRDDAYSLMSAAVDFGVTQVVNRTKGVHALVPVDAIPASHWPYS